MRKHELAKRLGITLSGPPQRSNGKPRASRRVEIYNADETTTTYPSMNKASQAMGRHAVIIYTLAKNGNISLRILGRIRNVKNIYIKEL